jgi:hypothetical protein
MGDFMAYTKFGSSISTRSIDAFVANVKGAAINLNQALSETLDWHLDGMSEINDQLRSVVGLLNEIGNAFDHAAHGGTPWTAT